MTVPDPSTAADPSTADDLLSERSIADVLADVRSRLPHRPDPAAAQEALARGAVLVDIRPAAQRRREGDFAEAVVVERNVLEWRFDPRSPDRLPVVTGHDLEVIVACSEGYASSLAAESLQRLGLRNATDLDGGFVAWKAAGLPIADDGGPSNPARAPGPVTGWQTPAVGFLDRVRSSLAWNGSSGTPRSGNGASSFHLFWDTPPGDWVEASASLEVVVAPSVPKLYFWALQVSFDEQGRQGGGAHLGLQWHRQHPGGTAVNWGGYGSGGGELDGSRSALPSETGNVNTRDYVWEPGRRYRLRVRRSPTSGPGGIDAWAGDVTDTVTGTTTAVRDLWATGSRLTGMMVWSEVFADCDEPSVVVRWSDLTVGAADGTTAVVTGARVNYQSIGDGGCRTTDSRVAGSAFEQITGTTRATPQGAALQLVDRS